MNIKKIALFVLTILIIVLTWPIFSAWFPILIKPWWWYPFGIIIAFFFAKEFFTTKQFFYIIIYAMVIFFNAWLGFVFLKPNYEKYAKILFGVFMLLLIYTTFASIYFYNLYPNVIRNDISIRGSDDVYEFSGLYKLGLTRYQFAHAIPMLIPCFIMALRERGNLFVRKLFFPLMVLICIVHSFVSGSTTAFIMSLVVTVLSFAITKGSSEKNMRRIVILSLLLLPLLNTTIFVKIFDVVDGIIGSEGVIHEHIVDIQKSVMEEGTEGDVSGRMDYYTASLNSFFINPIFGTNNEMGNHSVFIDHLGAFGLIGFIPFFAIFWNEYKSVLRKIKNTYHYYYFICILCGFCMLAIKNVNIWYIGSFLFIVAPIFIQMLSKAEHR